MTWIRSRISVLLYRNGRGIVHSEVGKLLKSYAHSDVLALLDISLLPWAEHREFGYNRNASFRGSQVRPWLYRLEKTAQR